jgi:hypothetical protein
MYSTCIVLCILTMNILKYMTSITCCLMHHHLLQAKLVSVFAYEAIQVTLDTHNNVVEVLPMLLRN